MYGNWLSFLNDQRKALHIRIYYSWPTTVKPSLFYALDKQTTFGQLSPDTIQYNTIHTIRVLPGLN